jgi:hypothetical protein
MASTLAHAPIPRTHLLHITTLTTLLAVATGYCIIGIQFLNNTIPALKSLATATLPYLSGANRLNYWKHASLESDHWMKLYLIC